MTPPFLFCPFVCPSCLSLSSPLCLSFCLAAGASPPSPGDRRGKFSTIFEGIVECGVLAGRDRLFACPPGKFTTFAKNSSGTAPDFCTKTAETSIFCKYIYTLHRVFLQKRMFPAKLTESSQEDNRFFASIGYCISTGNGAATVTLEHDSSSHQNDTPKPPPVTASRWG